MFFFSLVKKGFSSCRKNICVMKVGSIQSQETPALSRRNLNFKKKLKFQSCFGSVFLFIKLNLKQDLEQETRRKDTAGALCLVAHCCDPLKSQKFIYGFGQLPKCVLT